MARNSAASLFSDVESGGFSASREWFELLAKNRKGTAEVHIQDFHGRGGFRSFKECACTDKEGKPVQHNTEADYDAEKMAREAYAACVAYQKKHLADTRFRVQLMQRRKKDGELHEGPYVGMLIFPDGYTEREDYGRGTESAVVKILADHNRDLRTFLQSTMGAQVDMAQANGATMMMAHELSATMLQRQRDTINTVAPRQQATPEQVNQRIHEVASVVAEPLRMFAHASVGLHYKSAEQAQAELQHLVEDLSAEQKDQLKEALGEKQFGATLEVIFGPPDQFARERRWFRLSLKPHFAAIQGILTQEQWRRLDEAI